MLEPLIQQERYKNLIFASSGDGVATIIHQDAPDTYTVVDNVKTIRDAKTMAFYPKTGIIFSATVENVPPNATGPPNPKTVVYGPGPFVALAVEK